MKFHRTVRSTIGCILFLALIPCSPLTAQAEKPNVVLINVDDLGYGDVEAYGATHVQTPNIDQLAKEGRKFTDFHSASGMYPVPIRPYYRTISQ